MSFFLKRQGYLEVYNELNSNAGAAKVFASTATQNVAFHFPLGQQAREVPGMFFLPFTYIATLTLLEG